MDMNEGFYRLLLAMMKLKRIARVELGSIKNARKGRGLVNC